MKYICENNNKVQTQTVSAYFCLYIILMLNYNKSFRESNGKSTRKSIYSGNKLHTASMNFRVSQDGST